MMAKSRKGAQKVLTYIVLCLVALLIFIGLAMVGSEKETSLAQQIVSLISGVSISACEKVPDGDFAALAGQIMNVYNACDADPKKCGVPNCKVMTLNLGGGCMKIDASKLNANGLGTFVIGPTAKIRCCVTSAVGMAQGAEELDIYNPPDCTMQNVDVNRCDKLFNQYFTVADGATVTIRAEQSGVSNTAGTDIILKMRDEKSLDYTTCT